MAAISPPAPTLRGSRERPPAGSYVAPLEVVASAPDGTPYQAKHEQCEADHEQDDADDLQDLAVGDDADDQEDAAPTALGAAGAALRAKGVDQLALVHLRAALNAEFLGPLLEILLRPLLVWRRHASALSSGRLESSPARRRRAVSPRRLRAAPPGRLCPSRA